jgi:hypothetical protein
LLNKGITWTSSTELRSDNVGKLLNVHNRFFHKSIYQKLAALIARCFKTFENYPRGAFTSFEEIELNMRYEFDFFNSIINRYHPNSILSYTVPNKNSNFTEFKYYMNSFCTDLYFRDYMACLKNLGKAKSIFPTLKKEESS